MLYAFAPGIALAAAEVLGMGRRLDRRGRGTAVACCAAGVASLAVVAYLPDGEPALRAALGTIGCSLLVAGPLVHEWTQGRPFRLFEHRGMHYLGERSYAIYLVHVPLIVEFNHLRADHGPWTGAGLVAAVVVPLTLISADVLHRVVELPAMRLRTRWRRTPAQTARLRPGPPPDAMLPADEHA